jgi:glc operon protein GlcG
MIERKSLGLALAKKALDGAIAESVKQATDPVAVAVTDEHGDLIVFARMDRVNPIAPRLARRKAYTSAIQKADTGAWAASLKQQGRYVTDFSDPDMITFQGGVAIRTDGRVVGAIGVSGSATAQEDEELARAGLRAAGLAPTDSS